MFTVTLSNKSAIFDSGKFFSLEEAVGFARGRGGKYTVQIGRNDNVGISLSYDTDKNSFSRFEGYGWQNVSEKEIIRMIG